MSEATVKTGQGILALIEHRRRDLRAIHPRADKATQTHIESALGAVDGMLGGDLDRITDVLARQLVRWLESHEYLGAKELRELVVERGGR